ncbi:TetR/AcrR family transcriptional regulator [Acidisphaera rubrifaciens]|uniref:Transcriptional regulator TetR n=1 Tax=Acidisphaera rubrifaciens HS-AP3 TaxID=1231350 RepID=A0A0D6P5E8_9PROT|nr:TetR/AcrR family transcriptional regulator [Acidisphaera rubrifaciens]GAN76566.1 transcriptional regulator TetR [Acidisphaera rubrifaciens HS-AP3]
MRAAMLTFWRYGYETCSVADLTAAMGVNAPSLYAAFGDKKRLFLEAMHLYAGDPDELARAINDAPTACEAARTFMTAAATRYTGEATPRGCLLASATASGSAASADVQAAVTKVRSRMRSLLRKRIERDVASGVLPPETQAEQFANLTVAVTQGMSVLARDGASRDQLLSIAEAAMDAWPCLPPRKPVSRRTPARAKRLMPHS